MFIEKELYEKIISRTIPEPNTGCWLWTQNASKGYGQIRYKKLNFVSHRAVCAYTNNLSIKDKFVAMHLCNTPSCCNPSHLKPGTTKENAQYASKTTLTFKRLIKTKCKNGHELSGDNLIYDRKSKVCRKCRKAATLKHYHTQSKEQKYKNLKRSNAWKKRFYHANKDLMKKKQESRKNWFIDYRKRKREKDKLLICVLYSLGFLKINIIQKERPSFCKKGHPYSEMQNGTRLCKVCQSLKRKSKRENMSKEEKLSNYLKRKDYLIAWQKNNKEKVAKYRKPETRKAWRAANKDKINAKMKEWRKSRKLTNDTRKEG